MNDTLYKITRPFAYLLIQHPKKVCFDWGLPSCATLISLLAVSIFTDINVFFSTEKLAERMVTFVQILPGFYVAALAAIATFNRLDIDQTMPPPAPSVTIVIGGHDNVIQLTRRRFLSMLFAFLTSESIVFCIFGSFFISANLIEAKNNFLANTLFVNPTFWRYIGATLLIFLFWQLVTATFLGLYYLGDRLHQPDL